MSDDKSSLNTASTVASVEDCGEGLSRMTIPEAQWQDVRSGRDDRYLQAVLDCARSDPTSSSVRFIDCPVMEHAVAREPRIALIMEEIASHYEVPHIVLTWRETGKLCLKARHCDDVLRTVQTPDSQIFNHTLARELPIIMNHEDVEMPNAFRALPLERPRFYAAAPLVATKGVYIGTLCMLDGCRWRPDFSLTDADFLVQKAMEVCMVLENWTSLTAGSADRAPARI